VNPNYHQREAQIKQQHDVRGAAIGLQAVPAPASELDNEVGALGASIDALDIKLRQLGDRLTPVLADEPPTGNSAGPDEMSPRSPFARRLRELRLQVERTTAFAENRLHRDLAC
jgi:hypothetical protein